MTENLSNEPDLDFDAWLSGGARKAHYVTLYSRADLIADIEELEKRRVAEAAVREEDASLGGEPSPNAELDERIGALYRQLDESKREFRVTGLSEPELETVRAGVRKELKDEIDRIAADAREDAKATVRRMGNLNAVETNNVLRAKSLEAANKFIEAETSIRAISQCTTTKFNGEWMPVSEAQFRRLLEVIGAQVELLNRAFSRAANEAPVVTVPKS